MKRSTRKALAVEVSRALHDQGIDAVLVGGSVVSIYTSERYVTDDLDFVSYKPLKAIAPVLAARGWKVVGNRATHPAHALYLQFCAPPLAVGREPVSTVVLRTSHGKLETLSPTDCVLDRLMKLYHWDDLQGLEQAVLVAEHQPVDLQRVREVSLREGKAEQHKLFVKRLA